MAAQHELEAAGDGAGAGLGDASAQAHAQAGQCTGKPPPLADPKIHPGIPCNDALLAAEPRTCAAVEAEAGAAAAAAALQLHQLGITSDLESAAGASRDGGAGTCGSQEGALLCQAKVSMPACMPASAAAYGGYERREEGVRVLLAVDDTCMAASRAAFQFVCSRMLDLDKDTLLIAHCRAKPVQTPSRDGLYSCVKRANAEERRLLESSKAVLAEFHCLAGRARLNYFRLLSLQGDARERLVECAQEESVDFVVVGCKAKASGGLLHPLLMHGTSLSDYCLRNCSCPVLVVRETPQGASCR